MHESSVIQPSEFFLEGDRRGVLLIHGLTGTDVADAPKFADIAEQVRSALDVPALVAHNAHVDALLRVEVLNLENVLKILF